MDENFWTRNEDAILRSQHQLYDMACREDEPEYDPDGGYWDYQCDRWIEYADMEKGDA